LDCTFQLCWLYCRVWSFRVGCGPTKANAVRSAKVARFSPSIRLASLVAVVTGGCSLLAPSRDELSGGKSALALDGSSDTGRGGGDEGGLPGVEGGDAVVVVDDVSADAVDSGPDALTVLDCSGLHAAGQWEAITPPDVVLACPPNSFNCSGVGTEAFVLDPQTAGTIYLGTNKQGLWKSTNCGTTWSQLNTGTNSTTMSGGVQSMFEIDPVDPRVMYTKGTDDAGFKSTNGGVDWAKFWPPQDAALSMIVQYNQIANVSIDPLDHQHLLLTFRYPCTGTFADVCYAESKDAAATWTMRKGQVGWKSDSETQMWIVDATSWLYSAPPNGLWRSGDKGASWQQLADASLQGAKGRLLRADDGAFYLGSRSGVLRSRDGLVWALTSSPGLIMAGVVSDGTLLYATTAGVCFDWGTNLDVYWTSPVSDGKTWSKMAAPPTTQGGMDTGYDRQHHVFYSSNCRQGFWRVVTR
jgi:hypothetical protein